MIKIDIPRIKFTFDINNVINNISKHFSNYPHNCQINYDRMITQADVYNKLNYTESKRFCVLVSIYNAFPDIFKDFNSFIYFIKTQLRSHNDNYANMRKIVDILNDKTENKLLLFSEQDLQESYKIFCDNINENKPVVISYRFMDNKAIGYNFYQHAVTLTGYNDNFIYYHENSVGHYLFTSLALYLYLYYKTMPDELNIDNIYYDKIQKLLLSKTNDEVYESAKEIVGYNDMGNNIYTLNKSFLTNEQYFYNANKMITYTGKIEKYIPDDDVYCSGYDDKINFARLTEKLLNMKINF